MVEYNFSEIEKKWRDAWEEKKIFEVSEKKKKKFYVLDMFPYPSGEGLHMGHAFVFTLNDIYARFKRMKGFNVLYPIGYDALGLPAENAAIKAGTHPEEYTKKSIANFMRQQKAMGWSYDWSRMVNTSQPEYYKWDQWIFLKMFEKGLAYRKKAPVNWCPKCNSVLANEQVLNGKCWRHDDTNVEIRHLEQWFFRITDYADELLDKIDDLDWPQKAKTMQKNWIGKSYGTEIDFEINNENWKIFTTRPDTVFGVTFMVVSAQHPRLMELVTPEKEAEVKEFLKKIKSVSEKEMEDLEKEGVFTGSYATNLVTNEKVPIYIGNFVVADYGSGMVMAVPAHDQRDFEFAKKYDIPIKVVVNPPDYDLNAERMSRAYVGDGVLTNSGQFNGWGNRDAIDEITKFLEKKKIGKKSVQFKLRDWLVSRQRYWGTPIPIIYCESCGVVPVPENDLPVELPKDVKFGEGNPLLTSEEFVNVKCPKCGGEAKRELDTMDTFVNSSWYFLRYCDPHNDDEIFSKEKVDYWMPVDHYTGGPEHICMHLLYFRFYTKFLRDLGLLDFDEPAKKLFNQGMVLGADGNKMSKSLGNVVEPIATIEKFGADALRFFLVSIASLENAFAWNESAINGSFKFISRVYEKFSEMKFGKSSKRLESKINSAIKEISENIELFKYNLAVIGIRKLFEVIEEEEIGKDDAESFVKLIAPFCPYLAEELWEIFGNNDGKSFVCLSKFPKADESKIDEEIERIEKEFDKTVLDISNILRIIKEKNGAEAQKIYLYVIPNEVGNYDAEMLGKKLGKEVFVFAVNDSEKYDPEGKAGKAKPGRPAVFVE